MALILHVLYRVHVFCVCAESLRKFGWITALAGMHEPALEEIEVSLPDNLMVLTDLDGSLLDHHSYDWQPAAGWLRFLREQRVPVIANTSKTAAELGTLRQELGLTDYPCVVENGGCVLLPPGWRATADPAMDEQGWTRIHLGADYATLRRAVAALREEHGYAFRGFADLGVEGVQQSTGLPLAKAQQAHAREASEPLLWEDSEARLTAFRQALQQQGLSLVRGGRFYHVTGRSSKGVALTWLAGRYHQLHGVQPLTLALGDGANDLPMLATARYGVLIRGADYQPLLPSFMDDPSRLYRTASTGPTGWVEGLDYWLVAGLEHNNE